ncbi:MAG: hypothetical protein VCC01_06150 [Candidatus Hydrogenedentota bacterium]
MLRISNLKLPFDHDKSDLKRAILEHLGIGDTDLKSYAIARKSTDARKRDQVFFLYQIDVEVVEETPLLDLSYVKPTPDTNYAFTSPPAEHEDDLPQLKNDRLDLRTSTPRRPVVVGFGPCGMFAGLLLAQMGMRPLIIERGKKARARSKDVFDFWRKNEFNTDSNVQFGEGGAGTFSDGKLTTRIKNENNRVRKVLEELAKAGAPEEILYLAKPHIGTYKLIKVVRSLRSEITRLGGEVLFETQVIDIHIEDGALQGIMLNNGAQIDTNHLVVAIGHSARDTFQMLYDRGIHLDAKPFSIGARIEHPQHLIDRAQYGQHAANPILGAADYSLVHHSKSGRSAYSFCMCPGGQVVAAASEPGCVVSNGMSYYSRDEANANSALAVDITPADFPGDHPLAGVEFQRQWEEEAYRAGGENFHAPVQRLEDFLKQRPSKTVGEVTPSYQPGTTPSDLALCLPGFILNTMREAISVFDRKLRGYAHPDAVLTGVETRTSSPVRITRGRDFQSISTKGLYPAGEGAGYAGGIMSAAVDGIKVAEAIAENLRNG